MQLNWQEKAHWSIVGELYDEEIAKTAKGNPLKSKQSGRILYPGNKETGSCIWNWTCRNREDLSCRSDGHQCFEK